MTKPNLPSTLAEPTDSMPAATTSHQIGPMLRHRRKELNLTLAKVTDMAGIASGFLSEIERDQASPSVATLIRLCDALGISVGSLFVSSQPLLVRSGAREKMRYGGQLITYELLTSRTAHQMASIMSKLLPSGMSGPEQHTLNAEEEFVLVLNGEMIMEIGAQEFHLFEGDALTFDPRQKHRYLNPSKSQTCRTLCVITPQPR